MTGDNNEKAEKGIDIVLPWVDGSDPEWLKCKKQYLLNDAVEDNREERFRDWGILKYVFRSIETNTPWVRKVHFITWGHLPQWLNTDCEKLHIVNHTDYIPEQFLPTFNANTIELNIHRIEGLSEQFIYINDDMYFMKEMNEEEFFDKGLPCAEASLYYRDEKDSVFNGILYEDRKILNRNFDSRKVFARHFFEFVNLRNGFKTTLKNLYFMPIGIAYFPQLVYFHGPNAFLKTTFETVWEKESSRLSEVCSHKFRQFNDVNQYLMFWWQWCEGNIRPTKMKNKLKYVDVNKDENTLRHVITGDDYSMICVNDADLKDFEYKKEFITRLFEEKFPNKSDFEV